MSTQFRCSESGTWPPAAVSNTEAVRPVVNQSAGPDVLTCVPERAQGSALDIRAKPLAGSQRLFGALRVPRPLCGRGNEHRIRVRARTTGQGA